MDIDVYQQCPCHADKKIKFCCGKDILVDLNQVLAKNKSGQSQSALDQIDRAMEKLGDKDCLLTLKTHILITSGQIEEAKVANDLFLTTNGDHVTGLHHRALILLAESNIDEAVDALQDAMDAIKGNEIPISLANAFRMVGVGLYSQGSVIAARAHLIYASALKGDSDPELQQMLQETLVTQSTPLVLKQDFALGTAPEGVEWEKKFVNVIRAMDRGQFRKGLKFLNKINDGFPNEPLVLRSIAIVNGYLGRVTDMVAGFRSYSKLSNVRTIQAAEAEAIAQMFDEGSLSKMIQIERATFELKDFDPVSELALSNNRMSSSGAIEADPFNEGPAPRHAFVVLDKTRVSSPDDLTVDNVPNVIAELLLYGKQTDRGARIEAVVARDDRFDQLLALLKETFGEFLVSEEPKTQPLGESNAMSELLEWRWHLPEGVTRTQHAEMVKTQREHVILNEWVKLPFEVLDNKTPEEAAKDEKLQTPLRALMLMLENAAQGQFFNDELGAKLREKLGLADFDVVEVGENERISSPIQQSFVDFKKLSDEQLLAIQSDAMRIGNVRVLRKVVVEILDRPDFKAVTRDMCFSMMAHFSSDDQEALDYIEKACAEATKENRSIGLYLVQEFEFKLSRGQTDELPTLLGRIQKDHLDEPDVEYQLVRVLDRFGIGPDRGPLRGGPQQQPGMEGMPPSAAPAPAAVEAEPASGGIWTPDQDSGPPASDTSEGGGSGLYIPD